MKRSSRGFTLMELMLTIAIAATLIGIGVPAFRNFAQNGRLTGAANDMLVTLVAARNEAVRRQVRTSFCPTSTPDSNVAACNDAALQGYIAFVDTNGDCIRQVTEEIVSSAAPHSLIKARKNISCIGFAPNGFRVPVAGQPVNGHAVFCDDRGIAQISAGSPLSYARGLEVTATGRAQVTRLYKDLDLWASGDGAVTCP